MRPSRLGLALVLVIAVAFASACQQRRQRDLAAQEQRVAALEAQRDALRARLADAQHDNVWLAGMPEASVRIGVPTALATDISGRLITGLTDLMTLELANITVRKSGTIKKTITLGDYELVVTINRITAALAAAKPSLTFGQDRIGLRVPARVKSGSGMATVHFRWNGRRIAGVVCGDADITQVVNGTVRPANYTVAGAAQLSVEPGRLRVKIVVPPTKIHVDVDPSAASLAAVRKILADKGGACGLVVDRVDILGAVMRLVEKGFDITLPVDKIPMLSLPIEIDTAMTVRGQSVPFGVDMRGVAVTERMVWLGADVRVGATRPADQPQRSFSRSMSK